MIKSIKYFLGLSIIASSILFASEKISIPLPAKSLSIENSGIKQPIDAYQDGVGIYTLESLGANKVNNSEMNALVFKYGDVAKELNVSLKEYVQINGNDSEKELASTIGKFEPMVPGNGTVCNDNNAQTINDIYTNGICAGTNVEGQSCNDNNAGTINDKYVNGLCIGTMVPNGTVCNDNNAQTINDIYTNGICTGTNVEGQTCDDGLIYTINDKYINGVCSGSALSYTKSFTLPDAYPANITNWNVVSSTQFTSTGQFSAKFLTLPTSGKVKIQVDLSTTNMGAGISTPPVTTTWGNLHIGLSGALPYTLATFRGQSASAWTYGTGLYDFYLDIDAKKGQIIKNSNGNIISTFTFQAGDYLGIHDAASAGTGTITIVSAYKN